jgi:hypothetical protein
MSWRVCPGGADTSAGGHVGWPVSSAQRAGVVRDLLDRPWALQVAAAAQGIFKTAGCAARQTRAVPALKARLDAVTAVLLDGLPYRRTGRLVAASGTGRRQPGPAACPLAVLGY